MSYRASAITAIPPGSARAQSVSSRRSSTEPVSILRQLMLKKALETQTKALMKQDLKLLDRGKTCS